MYDDPRRGVHKIATGYVRTLPNFVGSCSQNCRRLCIDTANGGIYKIEMRFLVTIYAYHPNKEIYMHHDDHNSYYNYQEPYS